MKISAVHLANLLSYNDGTGLNRERVNLLLRNPNDGIDVQEFLKAYKSLIQTDANDYSGLHCGSLLHLKAMELVNDVTFCTTSVQQAIYVIQQYLEHTFPLVSLTLVQTKEKVTLKLDSTLNDYEVRRHILDGAFCFVNRGLQAMISTTDWPELRLPYDNLDEYRKYLQADVVTGTDFCFVFKKDILAKEINHQRVKELQILLPKFLVMLKRANEMDQVFSSQVRNKILSMCTPELPILSRIAAQFNMGERTFQRKLAQEKQSFRKISNGIRQELATYLTKDKTMKTQDVAFILGYSDPSAYLHALKNWKIS